MKQKNQKRIFIAVAIVFLMLLLYVSYDIGTRTTFPGAKNHSTVNKEHPAKCTENTKDTASDSTLKPKK